MRVTGPSPQSIVETLYRVILGREADPAGRDHFTALIANGGSSDDVAAAMLASPEYNARQTRRKHYLAKLGGSYTDEDVSYFMHRGRFRPLMISIETINICNNDCVICPYSAQTRQRSTMPQSLFKKIVRDYVEIGGGPVSLTSAVGEAFLDKHLLDRLAVLKDTPLISTISVTTNAVMAHRFNDDYLTSVLSAVDRCKISVYGLDREEYALMTRKDEYQLFRDSVVRILSFAKPGSVVLGIRHLRQYKGDEIGAWCTALERDAGVGPIEVASIAHEFANWSHFDTSKPLPLDGGWRPVTNNTKQCGLPLLSFQIMSDGRVSFCASADFDGTPDLVIGDVNDQSLFDILNSAGVANLWDWQAFGVPDFCKTCSFHIPLEQVAKLEWVYRNPVRFIGG